MGVQMLTPLNFLTEVSFHLPYLHFQLRSKLLSETDTWVLTCLVLPNALCRSRYFSQMYVIIISLQDLEFKKKKRKEEEIKQKKQKKRKKKMKL